MKHEWASDCGLFGPEQMVCNVCGLMRDPKENLNTNDCEPPEDDPSYDNFFFTTSQPEPVNELNSKNGL